MSKAAVFTMKLEADLRAEFMAAVESSHRPASQVVRELMRGFVQQQRYERERAGFLQAKVDRARASVGSADGLSDGAVEASFAVRRAGIADGA